MRVSPKYDPEYHGTVIRTNYIPKFYQNAVYICPFGLFENIELKPELSFLAYRNTACLKFCNSYDTEKPYLKYSCLENKLIAFEQDSTL